MKWIVFIPWMLLSVAGLLGGLIQLAQIPDAIAALDLPRVTMLSLTGAGMGIFGCIAALLLVKKL
ncbi:hypothetical protein [Stenotrophomonas sp. GD03657]|uniref:hypothetical protein n=1 Tax=Stenotrophomonas sp. GD03657 TaxID=2975363 RepID=UPI00244CFE53|nr:hypothetical protein [Stenotrophomonas sp. GD03657]MDH2154062.1 hypothetical protein [Stenotrophomonas sp. GD03657]